MCLLRAVPGYRMTDQTLHEDTCMTEEMWITYTAHATEEEMLL
jgi:hypothetical protein